MIGWVSKKLDLKEGMRASLVNAPKTTHPVNLEIAVTLRGNFDYIHFFTKSQA